MALLVRYKLEKLGIIIDHGRNTSHPTTDVRCKATTTLQRQLRTSTHSSEPMQIRDILPAVEVCGKLWRHLFPELVLRRYQDQRHSYEKCQYEEFKERVAKMDKIREAKNGQRSN